MYALVMVAPGGIERLLKRIPTSWSRLPPPSAPSSKSKLVRSTLPLLILSSASSEEEETQLDIVTVGVAVGVGVFVGVGVLVGGPVTSTASRSM